MGTPRVLECFVLTARWKRSTAGNGVLAQSSARLDLLLGLIFFSRHVTSEDKTKRNFSIGNRFEDGEKAGQVDGTKNKIRHSRTRTPADRLTGGPFREEKAKSSRPCKQQKHVPRHDRTTERSNKLSSFLVPLITEPAHDSPMDAWSQSRKVLGWRLRHSSARCQGELALRPSVVRCRRLAIR